MINIFEETVVDKKQILELEGTKTKFFYLMLEGEVTLYKQPAALYSADKGYINV